MSVKRRFSIEEILREALAAEDFEAISPVPCGDMAFSESAMLFNMASNNWKAVSYESLFRSYHLKTIRMFDLDKRVIRTHISRIRAQLPSSVSIEGVTSFGCRFQAPADGFGHIQGVWMGDLIYSHDAMALFWPQRGTITSVSALEDGLLYELAQGGVASPNSLARRAGIKYENVSNRVSVLRKKMGYSGDSIKAVRQQGYLVEDLRPAESPISRS